MTPIGKDLYKVTGRIYIPISKTEKIILILKKRAVINKTPGCHGLQRNTNGLTQSRLADTRAEIWT